MLMRVEWTKKALSNLDNAVEYIAADNPAAARKVAQKIWDTTQLLTKQPGLGRPGRVSGTRELVITGRGATEKMIEKADLVTEMKEIKHYYSKGVMARIGIEK